MRGNDCYRGKKRGRSQLGELSEIGDQGNICSGRQETGSPGLGEQTETAASMGSGKGRGPGSWRRWEGVLQQEVSICDYPERGLDTARHRGRPALEGAGETAHLTRFQVTRCCGCEDHSGPRGSGSRAPRSLGLGVRQEFKSSVRCLLTGCVVLSRLLSL